MIGGLRSIADVLLDEIARTQADITEACRRLPRPR